MEGGIRQRATRLLFPEYGPLLRMEFLILLVEVHRSSDIMIDKFGK